MIDCRLKAKPRIATVNSCFHLVGPSQHCVAGPQFGSLFSVSTRTVPMKKKLGRNSCPWLRFLAFGLIGLHRVVVPL